MYLKPDVTCAVPTWKAHLMAESWTIGLSTEIDKKIFVHRQTTHLCVHIDQEKLPALLHQVRVELFIPGTEQAGGNIKPLAVERELQHLRSSLDLHTLQNQRLRLLAAILTSHTATLLQKATNESLPNELRLTSIRNIILPNVAMEPTCDIYEAVIQGYTKISDERWHLQLCRSGPFQN